MRTIAQFQAQGRSCASLQLTNRHETKSDSTDCTGRTEIEPNELITQYENYQQTRWFRKNSLKKVPPGWCQQTRNCTTRLKILAKFELPRMQRESSRIALHTATISKLTDAGGCATSRASPSSPPLARARWLETKKVNEVQTSATIVATSVLVRRPSVERLARAWCSQLSGKRGSQRSSRCISCSRAPHVQVESRDQRRASQSSENRITVDSSAMWIFS